MNHSQPGPDTLKSKRRFWKDHIENWQESGLTQVEYCKDQQLKISTFLYWKAKLAKQRLSKPLLPVSIKSEVTANTRSFPSGISLSVKDRYTIELEIGFNPDTLHQLLDFLEARSCFGTT